MTVTREDKLVWPYLYMPVRLDSRLGASTPQISRHFIQRYATMVCNKIHDIANIFADECAHIGDLVHDIAYRVRTYSRFGSRHCIRVRTHSRFVSRHCIRVRIYSRFDSRHCIRVRTRMRCAMSLWGHHTVGLPLRLFVLLTKYRIAPRSGAR